MRYILRKFLVLILAASLSLFIFLPPEQNEIFNTSAPVPDESALCSVTVSDKETRISSRLWELLFGKEKEEGEREVLLLIPGGAIFGAKVRQSYVTVQNPQDVKELKVGDKILTVNGHKISSVSDVRSAISQSGDGEIALSCERDGKHITVKIKPKQVGEEYKLGIVLKDGAAGIGTITYVDPITGEFGGLGHGICDTDTGEVIDFTEGQVTGVILSGVKKGEEGKPGELCGLLTDKVSGQLYANTECGVFGRLDTVPDSLGQTAVEIARKDEVREGEATILSTVKLGTAKEYKIEISEINKSSTGTKSFKIKVTDPTLIAITGGVVRGMSGSPIIQDGKLVGAVTHVMVANPTEGYGIFIENMLNASQTDAQKAA
jgi:stage IV sporulation protein B